jgi:deazaflavin-dependent oxidoreductase (nitroreductase family)
MRQAWHVQLGLRGRTSTRSTFRVTSFKEKPKPKGLDRPSTLRIMKVMSRLHSSAYKLSGGRIGKNWRIGSAVRKAVPICLLTTTGKKTGLPRTVPLCFLADGASIVLVASQGGTPNDPQWYRNLVAEPNVTVAVGRQARQMRARTATPGERTELWPRLVDAYADYANYQTWTDREIPVVICEPA